MAGTSNSFRRRDKKFSKKMQRTLDPAMLLSRGMSARFVGANVMHAITPLSKEEVEKDLRHMNAYYAANVAYAQHHYIFMNRDHESTTGVAQPQPGVVLPGTVGAAAAAGAAALASADNNGVAGEPTAAAGPGAAPGSVAAAAAAAAGYYGRTENIMVPPIAMPVRIDPEEEKRLQNLRKKIALCETQREILESQYVSLRAHYVATTKELDAAAKHSEGLVVFLQAITKRRSKVLAIQRARLQIARDVMAALQSRLEILEKQQLKEQVNGANGAGAAADSNSATKMDVDSPGKTTTNTNELTDDDIIQVWNDAEEMLKEAEMACRKIPSTLTRTSKKSKKKSKKNSSAPTSAAADATGAEEDAAATASTIGTIPWEAMKMPNTPQEVPLYLSQLSLVPEKGAAFGTSGVFGSNKASMCWMESSMPPCYNADAEKTKVSKLRDEVALLQEELDKERAANRDIQLGIIGRRKRSDELVAMMTLLRGETEVILQRHNILLDSEEAKDAARELHEEAMRTRAKAGVSAPGVAGAANSNGSDGKAVVDSSNKKSPPSGRERSRRANNDDENDGDDEGLVDEDDEDEDGEIHEEPTKEWSGRGKRESDGEDVTPGRKRRKP